MRGIRWSSIRSSWLIAFAAVLLIAVGSVVTAQSQNQQNQSDQQWRTRDQSRQQTQGMEYQRVGDLLGADVYGRDGEKIGSFHDIVFDENHERVIYAVISEGGWMGTEGDLHAIPWTMVQSQPRDNRVVLPVGKASFENRQPISDNYPNPQLDQTAQQWTSVQKWEQTQAAKDGSSRDRSDKDENIFERSQRERQSRSQSQARGDDPQMRRVNDLLGMNVQFSGSGSGSTFGYDQRDGARTNGRYGGRQQMSGSANGNLEDLLIHRDGRVEFALVQPNTDFIQIGEDEYVAVPWDRIDVQFDRDMVIADLSSSEAHALVIDDNEISRLNDPNFRNRFFSDAGLGDSYARRDNGSRARTGSMGQQQAMEQWSDFASQCLGSGLNKQNQVVEGRVLTVGTLRTNPDSDAPHGRMITVETANNRDMRVYLGPQELVPENFNIREGAQVTVRGTECQIDNRDIMVASSVEVDGQTFTLTQQNGTPHWMSSGDQSAQRQFGQQADLQKWSSFTDQCLGPSLNRANTTISGTVRSVGTLYTNENADAPDGRRIVVQTRENDRVTVYTGPMGQVSDPLQLSRGDEVTIRGSECQIENRTVFVAATIETDDQTYRLTERNGVPSWSPEGQQQRGGRR